MCGYEDCICLDRKYTLRYGSSNVPTHDAGFVDRGPGGPERPASSTIEAPGLPEPGAEHYIAETEAWEYGATLTHPEGCTCPLCVPVDPPPGAASCPELPGLQCVDGSANAMCHGRSRSREPSVESIRSASPVHEPCSSIPPVVRHESPAQIPGMRHSTSALQGHNVDEPEAVKEALRRSIGLTPMDPRVHAEAGAQLSSMPPSLPRQTSMAPSELQRISLVMITYGELIFSECQSEVDHITFGFLGSVATADEQPRACAQRVVGEALSHRHQRMCVRGANGFNVLPIVNVFLSRIALSAR